MSWISGTLELTSKVRYGISSHGNPLFRFIPYDKRWAPFAVASSIRDFSTNVHAIIEPIEGTAQKGSIVQLLGKPTEHTEKLMLLMSYAYDSRKDLRKIIPSPITLTEEPREVVNGFTFHIDPPGCKDVDDAFTFVRDGEGWKIYIHIADVAAWVAHESKADSIAKTRATSFYSTDGIALAPMFPGNIEESASLLPGRPKPAVSLVFSWKNGTTEFKWVKTLIQCNQSFTYDEAMQKADTIPELAALREFAGEADSHLWVQNLMILYNTKAGSLLREMGKGILRRHSGKKQTLLDTIGESGLSHVGMAAAEYVDAREENVVHVGLQRDAYAYASSPIRRYCDLVNQRILKDIMSGRDICYDDIPELVIELNRRQKQEKAFTRDIFFMQVLSGEVRTVRGTAVSEKRVWIPEWKRSITIRSGVIRGDTYSITWYENKTLPHWKDKIVFRAEKVDDTP